MMLDKIKFLLWMSINGPLYHLRHALMMQKGITYNGLNSEETVRCLISTRLSVCRFGDGEFQMIERYLSNIQPDHEIDSFQHYDASLAKKLYEVLTSNEKGVLICIPYALISPSVYHGYDKVFYERQWVSISRWLYPIMKDRIPIGDACFTRFYLHRKDIRDYSRYIQSLKGIWDSKDILIVEGKHSRLGVGNDLFANALSISRILCPSQNAFAHYDEILNASQQYGEKRLILIALGQTATVLAYDLSMQGYHAIDIGHIDIEYEWLRMGVKEKVPVPGKYVNEVVEGRYMGDNNDPIYLSQIICEVL